MSVTSSTDAVQAVTDILNNENQASDWTNGGAVPDRIERAETSDPSQKTSQQRLDDVALYVFSPAEGDISKFSFDNDAIQDEVVQIDIYTDDAITTNNYASDVIAIMAQYATDNEQQTAWVDIWPSTPIDNIGQAFWYGSFAILSVQVTLRRHFAP